MNDPNNKMRFINTMVHEKIHILQRYNTTRWDNYILKQTTWSIIPYKPLVKKASYYKIARVYNPDTFYINKLFVIKQNNKIYYGELVKKNNSDKVVSLWYELYNKNDHYELYPTNNISKYEHPYEELAYKLSNEYVK
jgi:hypothetical protein